MNTKNLQMTVYFATKNETLSVESDETLMAIVSDALSYQFAGRASVRVGLGEPEKQLSVPDRNEKLEALLIEKDKEISQLKSSKVQLYQKIGEQESKLYDIQELLNRKD